jgi:hypothetical protein
MPINILNFTDNGILGANNHNRVDRNNFRGGDESNSKSWNRSRGNQSKGHGGKHGGRKHDCKD